MEDLLILMLTDEDDKAALSNTKGTKDHMRFFNLMLSLSSSTFSYIHLPLNFLGVSRECTYNKHGPVTQALRPCHPESHIANAKDRQWSLRAVIRFL